MLIRKFKQVLVTSMVLFMATSAYAEWDSCCPDFDACASEWCCGRDAEIYADFLYWQTGVGGLEFARAEGIGASATTPVTTNGEIFDVDCSYDPGVRVGLIMDLCKCNWDFYADWTYLYERYGASKTQEIESSGLVSPGLVTLIYNQNDLDPNRVQTARGNWDNRLQVLNAGFGRTFDACGCFLFRPHFGIKATWQTMKTRIVYDKTTNIFAQNINRTTMSFRTDFDGVGLRGGFDTSWVLNNCIRVVGNVAMSAVWSDLCLSRKDFFQVVQNDGQIVTDVNNIDIKQNDCALIPVLELLFGVRFDTCICCEYPAYVMLGWENQVWFDLNRMILLQNFSSDENNIQFGPVGNVHYQGLVVRAGFGF